MIWLRRLLALFTWRRDERRMQEEFEQHVSMATEEHLRSGLSEADARRQALLEFGGVAALQDAYRDQRTLPGLQSLLSDVVFGWRQLNKNRTASAAMIVSLALATGACTSAFRLMDALLWRPLPVANPGELYTLARLGIGFNGQPSDYDAWAYPAFQRMRAAIRGQGELIAISYVERTDVTYRSDEDMEKANLQFVSGWMFTTFGLQPAAGRLLTGQDDLQPGAHPVAVLSHDYWMRRFGGDRKAIGQTLRLRDRLLEIVGVGPAGFTGTEPGIGSDIFVPTMMQPAVVRADSSWHRTFLRLNSGMALETVRQKLGAVSREFERERMQGENFARLPKGVAERLVKEELILRPAAAGASGLQQNYRRTLLLAGGLVLLVLLIAGVNLANLLTAQSAARAREMAIRVSIGAGRGRLAQLLLVETALLAGLASALGGVFAWWSAPFIVSRINPASNPVRLDLPADWRVLAFSLILTSLVIVLFGMMPALRASAIEPVHALKGGARPQSRGRAMHALIAVQVAFCFLVLFVAGLFTTSFDRLSRRPLAFSAEQLLNVETVARERQEPVVWDQVLESLRTVAGVDSVAMSAWPLLNGWASNGFISVNGALPGPVMAYFLAVTPGWAETVKMQVVAGTLDLPPGTALVNETFAQQYFRELNPVGRSFVRGKTSFRIVGVLRDVPYRSLREPILPVAFVPFEGTMRQATFVVRTKGVNSALIAAALRRAVSRANMNFRVSNVRTQVELIESQTLRERLLAMVAMFFSGMALLLAAVGLYGVLNYAVLQRRREIGIRLAIGAAKGSIVRLVTGQALLMVLAGAAAGLGLGMASARWAESLLYEVKPEELVILTMPLVAIVVAAALAALVPVLRAVRIEPVTMLRVE